MRYHVPLCFDASRRLRPGITNAIPLQPSIPGMRVQYPHPQIVTLTEVDDWEPVTVAVVPASSSLELRTGWYTIDGETQGPVADVACRWVPDRYGVDSWRRVTLFKAPDTLAPYATAYSSQSGRLWVPGARAVLTVTRVPAGFRVPPTWEVI